MIIDKIIVSEESFRSNNHYDIVYSNVEYVDNLLNDGITTDNISESALKSYYVYIYFIEVNRGGFSQLDKRVEEETTILYYIQDGLEAIRATKNINLFNQYLGAKEKQDKQNYKIFDKLFVYINKQEDILQLNANWLKSNRKLSITNSHSFSKKYIENSIDIQTIKKLCKLANEEYVRITSYDHNNLYNNSYHFKTINSYFYMIKEEKRYVMYNSFTKKEVSSILIKKEQKKGKFFSTLWSSIKGRS